ncbi:MAG: helix-turn-helix transcriptional regulator, partial [Gammaproteobacteria bacterium]|nr:helix-turn-helix transcriptional regulator [Gammaproteobacteria bacterium]
MPKTRDNQTSTTAAAAPRPPVRAFRSPCPIARTLDLFGDKWTLVVMRDALFFDCRTFADFANCSEKIPTNLLAERLKRLVLIGMLEK